MHKLSASKVYVRANSPCLSPLCPKVYLSERKWFVICSCKSRFLQINVDPGFRFSVSVVTFVSRSVSKVTYPQHTKEWCCFMISCLFPYQSVAARSMTLERLCLRISKHLKTMLACSFVLSFLCATLIMFVGMCVLRFLMYLFMCVIYIYHIFIYIYIYILVIVIYTHALECCSRNCLFSWMRFQRSAWTCE